MRVGLLAAALTISVQTICWAEAAHVSQAIKVGAPTLAPMAFTQFCQKYVDECKPQQPMFRGGRIKLTNLRWTELVNVNSAANSSIRPEPSKEGIADHEWLLGPAFGNCNDYAVTKRHQLTARGWPARAVLLSEVVTFSGQHHVVVVVRTNIGDVVLDNLTDVIMPWFQKPFQWVRIQTPRNPNYWASISEPSAAPMIARRPVPERFTASLRSGVI
jgi:predicted transglutaminase-like cysteine proteinase